MTTKKIYTGLYHDFYSNYFLKHIKHVSVVESYEYLQGIEPTIIYGVNFKYPPIPGFRKKM